MSEFAGRISRPRPERAGTGVATRPATRTPAGVPIWDPLDLDPYLYFDAAVNVSDAGGSVSLWYGQWYGGSAPSNGLANYLKQGTAEWQPTHSTDGYIQFDAVDTRLEYDPATTQAGVLICATDNGCFAYEVDADSIDEVTALGWETGYFQALKLYAMVLLPATVSDVQIAGAIEYLVSVKGATRNPTGSINNFWRQRSDLVTPKLDSLDFSGVTSFNSCWRSCASLTEFPSTLDLSSGQDFGSCWHGCTSLTSFPAVKFSTAPSHNIDFDRAWQDCTSLTSFPSDIDLSRGTSFWVTWASAAIVNFPALDLSAATNVSYAWTAMSSLVTWGACNVNASQNFYNGWKNSSALTTFPAGVFDDWTPASVENSCFTNAWDGCSSLTPTSAENILNSLATAGVAAPSSGVDITIDHAAGTVSAATAIGVLKGLGWTITLNGTPQ